LCWEGRNIETIISQAADESLGKYKAITQKKKLQIWVNGLKLFVQQKCTIQKYVETQTMDNETEYRHRRATAKREIRNDIANPGNNLYHT
jgi:hypothetical protein